MKRPKIVCVLSHYDDERTMPWSFVTKKGKKFVAWTTEEIEEGRLDEYCLGTFPTVNEAMRRVWLWEYIDCLSTRH